MRLLTLFILTIGFSLNVFSQKNTIKGRALGTYKLFSLGIGYERLINNKISAQVLFNRMAVDFRDTDGNAKYLNSIVPELRYYLGKNENKKMFLGIFTEASTLNFFQGGERVDDILNKRILTKDFTKIVAPGVLLGINNGTKKRWIFDFYTGVKYRFRNEEKEYFLNQEKIIESQKNNQIGIRVGLNIGFRF